MALGLNIIVGFAGLLDLGYVAFFALGALTAGLVHVRLLRRTPARAARASPSSWAEPASSLPGIHLNFLIVVIIAVVDHARSPAC